MERPHDGRSTERHEEQTAQRHECRADRARASQPCEHTNQDHRERGRDFGERPPHCSLAELSR